MVEPLPPYVQDPPTPFDTLLTRIATPISKTHPDARTILQSFVEGQKAPAYDANIPSPKKKKNRSKSKSTLKQPLSRSPIDHYPPPLPTVHGSRTHAHALTHVKQQIVTELFNAIRRGDAQAVELLIQHNLVSPNTTGEAGETPLLEAISTKNIAIVKEVLGLGADCNKFGVFSQSKVPRTPLMLAATIGSLPIVKLLIEPPYSANDALIAPDGQIALRLASANDHRSIVTYLPSRRAGGYLRFKTHHAQSIQRIKEALHQIGTFIKFFVWDLPKFFVWVIPKHLVLLPFMRGCVSCWVNRRKIGIWCKLQLVQTPKRVVRFGKAVWKMAKKIPGAIWGVAKKIPGGIWRAAKKIPVVIWKAIKKTPSVIWNIIKDVYQTIREIVNFSWTFLTVRIPNAIHIAFTWLWSGLTSLTQSIIDIFLKIISLFHTTVLAIITFLHNVTLIDIWNALCDFLRAVFVTLPKTLWFWIYSFGEASYRFMKALLGFLGEALWLIANFGVKGVVFIPKRLGIILLSVGDSIAKGFAEIMVWISPKA